MGSSDDRSILLELFHATNGPLWERKQGWNTTANISTWIGVTVDKDGRVVKLELIENHLQGAIPESLGRLSKLMYLGLSGNQLSGAIPESLGELTKLTYLGLSRNQLSDTIPESLGQLSSLTSLLLYSNQLSGAIPESLGQLRNLVSLYLYNNQLSGAIPESLGKLSNMTKLGLSINHLSGPIPASLGRLSNLTYLGLSRNQLSGTIPESLGQMSKLTCLNLHNNQLSGTIPDSLGQLFLLTSLRLYSNQLSGVIPESLGQLANLTKLGLSRNQLSGVIPGSLGQLSNLTSLNLYNNQLSGAIPESLGQLSKLEGLILYKNHLSGISEEAAKGLQRLRCLIIYIGNNPWTSPPADVVDAGLDRVVGYWEAIARSGAIVSWKLKVVLVGAVKAGKTSLVNGMINGQPQLCRDDDRTKGVEVRVGGPCKPDAERELELTFWDFAGHSEYYSTHQIFLSKGALNLLVVDLKRFYDEPSARGELVDVWLDALQCRVPGSNVLVVATQIDRLAGNLEEAVKNLQLSVENHPSMKRNELGRTRHVMSTSWDEGQALIFHGVETVSSACSESLLNLRLKISSLVYSKREMFPSVGRRRPVSWARVSAMLNAKQSGKDPILQASRVGTVEENQVGIVERFIHRVAAIDEWHRVVRTLKLEKEVGSTAWDIIVRKFKRRGNSDRNGTNAVFEDAVGQLVREGKILDSGEILYLEPTWINDLLQAILDHDLADFEKDHFWKDELQKFSDGSNEIYWDLKKIHDNFPSTGILTVKYLRFLWRNVTEIHDKALFDSLLGTMSRHGIIFQSKLSPTGSEDTENALKDSAELFVPLHLPSTILECDLGELTTLLQHQFRNEIVYEIRQPYIPPGILGLLMARFRFCEGVEFRKCWSRGVIFTLGEVLVLLHLNNPSHGEDEAQITVNLFGERYVSELKSAMKKVEHEIKSVFVGNFGGLFIGLKQGYPREVGGICALGDRCARTGDRKVNDSISTVDAINAVVARIDGLESHLDRELSHLLQGLHQIEHNLLDVAKNVRTTLERLNKLKSGEVPFPSLVIVRPAAAIVSGRQKHSLTAMVNGLGRRAKKLVCKDMRLCFLCPYDFSEVPCGLDGNGYPFTATRDWISKIRPALKVTAMLAKVAIKVASGLDLPVSDFLNGAKSYLGEELTDRMLDDGAVERALNGTTGPGEGEVKMLVGEAYEELKTFMNEQKSKDTRRYVHFDRVMQLVDDEECGKVWVSNENVELWKNART